MVLPHEIELEVDEHPYLFYYGAKCPLSLLHILPFRFRGETFSSLMQCIEVIVLPFPIGFFETEIFVS